MAKKKRRKAPKRPHLPPHHKIRQQVDDILARYRSDEFGDAEVKDAFRELAQNFPRRPLFDVLLKVAETVDGPGRGALMVGIPAIANEEDIAHLWRVVESRKYSIGVRSTALVILEALGEDVDPTHPEYYFSIEDATPASLSKMERLAWESTQEIIKELRRAGDENEVEAIMYTFHNMADHFIDGTQGMVGMLDMIAGWQSDEVADYFMAVAATTPFPEVRRAAQEHLQRLAEAGYAPTSPVIQDIAQERFYQAYVTDPDNPWQQQLLMAWQRANGMLQGIVFLLDFGHPWRGAIKDMFVTKDMSEDAFQEHFIEKAWERMMISQVEIGFDEGQRVLRDALEANRRYGIDLPPEYEDFKHLITRRILNPPS